MMTFVHPLQSAISNNAGTLIFVAVKNIILIYKKIQEEYILVGKWIDESLGFLPEKSKGDKTNLDDKDETLSSKKLKTNDGAVVKQSEATYPATYSQIRNLLLSQDEKILIACADSDKSVLIFEIDHQKSENCLKLIKRQTFPKRPNAITLTSDQKTLIIADKFGDVYPMSIQEDAVAKIDDAVQPILGHVSMLTDVVMTKDTSGKRYIITSDRDEHIKISHFPQCFIVNKWLFGHTEFVSSLCSPQWKQNWLFSAGGDDLVFAWDWEAGKKLSQFDYRDLIKPHLTTAHLASPRFQNEANSIIEYAVSKLVSPRNLPILAFFVEATKLLIILDVDTVSGALSLKQSIELPYNVISISERDDEFLVTLDNHESDSRDFVQFIIYDKESDTFKVEFERSRAFDKAIARSLTEDKIANVETTDIHQLYNIISLKKHGEHYS